MAGENQQEKEFSIQPIKEDKSNILDAVKQKVAPHISAPGPAQSHDHSQIPQEGTKEERMAKAKELNK